MHMPLYSLCLESFHSACGSPVNGVRFRGGSLIFAPQLDALVCLAGDKPRACHIELRAEHTRFALERARLGCGGQLLEVIAAAPVPEERRSDTRNETLRGRRKITLDIEKKIY